MMPAREALRFSERREHHGIGPGATLLQTRATCRSGASPRLSGRRASLTADRADGGAFVDPLVAGAAITDRAYSHASPAPCRKYYRSVTFTLTSARRQRHITDRK